MLIDVTLTSGVTVRVRRLSPILLQQIAERAKTLYPLPDPAGYRVPLKNAAEPGLYEPVEMNPDYRAAQRDAILQQNAWYWDKVLRCDVVDSVAGESREETLARLGGRLDIYRAALGELDAKDDWQALVLYELIQSADDRALIVKAAQNTLTQGDVDAAAESFRRYLQRASGTRHREEQGAPGVSDAGGSDAGDHSV